MRKKGVVLLVLVLLMGILLCGCSSLTYSVQIAAGGARTLKLRVNLENGVSAEERQAITQFLRTVAENRNRNGRNCTVTEEDNSILLSEEFESATDYYIAMGITGDEPNEEELPYVDLNAYFVEYVSESFLADDATVISYALQYAYAMTDGDIMTAWRIYCALQATMLAESDPLRAVYAELSYTDAGSLLPATLRALSAESGNRLCADLKVWLAMQGYDLGDVNLRYTYEHTYRSIYGANCTSTYVDKETGATVYQWDMTADKIPVTLIELRQKAPRVWAWELTAIAAGLVALGVIGVILLCKRRKVNHGSGEERQ